MVLDHIEFDGHEHVAFCSDTATGLRAIIAVHSTALGPAAGGCRYFAYTDEQAALTDVLRLSAAMTWKNALAGLPLGGGKSVIIADPERPKTPELLAAFARAVNKLGGNYWTAEDVGTGLSDVEELARHSPYIFGLASKGAKTGDPSPFTARGVLRSIEAAVAFRLGRSDLSGVSVLIQGVGNVGRQLALQLAERGADVLVSDVNATAVEAVAEEISGRVVPPDQIFDAEMDVYAPCALGGTLTRQAVDQLKAAIVAGAANNQLARPEVGEALRQRGICYVPDFVANAGGMLNASGDILGTHDPSRVTALIDNLAATVTSILAEADKSGLPTNVVAEQRARAIVAEGRK